MRLSAMQKQRDTHIGDMTRDDHKQHGNPPVRCPAAEFQHVIYSQKDDAYDARHFRVAPARHAQRPDDGTYTTEIATARGRSAVDCGRANPCTGVSTERIAYTARGHWPVTVMTSES